jgi:hypothetical protein
VAWEAFVGSFTSSDRDFAEPSEEILWAGSRPVILVILVDLASCGSGAADHRYHHQACSVRRLGR